MDEYSLLVPQTIYKKETKRTGGYWNGGIYVEGTPATTYKPLSCFWEPDDGQQIEILPEGVRSSDVVWIDTNESLKVDSDYGKDSSLSDVVYLYNPETNSTAKSYRIIEKWDWGVNEGFELLQTHQYNYLAVREKKDNE